MADMHDNEVERVATAIADAVGSQCFKPLHDEDMPVRERFRELARQAVAVNADEVYAALRSVKS